MTQLLPHHFSAFDYKMMALAIRLAEKGRYSTTPNPHVGCVLVNKLQEIVGEGFHVKAGQGHAEVNALAKAGCKAKGAIAYVTLEPCAHINRTGSCASALVKAGVSEVIIACSDPNPKVAGKGIRILEAAGISVKLGLMQTSAEALNEAFFWRMQRSRPFITVKLAASIDGRTALASGESKWITSPSARNDVQRLRASSCAILTGADTVIADNPQLNVRVNSLPSGIAGQFLQREKQPLRVIIDSQNRLNVKDYQIFNDEHATLVYNLRNNVKLKQSHVSHIEPEQEQVAENIHLQRPYVDLLSMLDNLGKREINHLWVEAGAKLTGALFDAGLVNQLVLYQAPMLLGKEGRPLSEYASPDILSKALQGKVIDVRQVGPDVRTIIRLM